MSKWQGSTSVEESARRHPERLRQLFDNCCCWVALGALDLAYIGPVDPGLERIGLLGPALFQTEPANISAEASEDIHLPTQACPQTINLQAMSDNCP
jgi:hypothetical protein